MAFDTANPRTMIVDDDRVVRQILAQMLTANGSAVEQAASAGECIQIANSKNVDAFLIDLQLPDGDGIQLCRRLRQFEAYRHAPMIIITADQKDETLSCALKSGADDYIVKPVSQSVLEARLGAHLARVQYQRNLSRYVSGRTQQVAAHLSKTGALPPPEQREVCVLFSDVRGFTQLSAVLGADTLFDLLSRNLGMQVDIIYANGGYVDKYAGDGIMAVFDANDRSAAACRSALEIIAMTRCEQGRRGLQDLQIGIGIHAGSVLVGNIGSATHLDYSAIGQTVNLAARLCGCADPMSVVISGAVADQLAFESGFKLSAPVRRRIRGIEEPLSTYTLQAAPLAAAPPESVRQAAASS